MKYDINTAINEFIKGIDKGPFKCLKDSMAKDSEVKDSEAVSGSAVSGPNNKPDIYECAVYQAWLDTCRTESKKQ